MQFLKSILGTPADAPKRAVTAAEAKALLDSNVNAPLLIDVRQPDEFRTGHAPDARLIPLGDLNKRMSELPKDRQILVICASGSRSSMATHQLVAAGYDAVNVRGGMMGWMQAGLPVKR
jgi:rhodanese-related sulfurtransferase